MRKTKQTKVTKTEIQTTDILCNKCGKSCSNALRAKRKPDWQEFTGLIEVEVSGGYHSEVIGDMSQWRFSICEHCLSNIVKSFKIPHEVSADGSEYKPLPEFIKESKKLAEANKQEFINFLVKNCNYKKTSLAKKTSHELYDLYHKELTKNPDLLKNLHPSR